jgi:hypothetical protein
MVWSWAEVLVDGMELGTKVNVENLNCIVYNYCQLDTEQNLNMKTANILFEK